MRGRGGGFGIRLSLFAYLGLSFLSLLPLRGLPGGWASGRAAGQEPGVPAGTVVGRITEEGTELPQVGAFVALLDSDGGRRTAVLTDEAGRYVLRVPAAGRYRLRVEGLGVASTFGEFFDFAPGEVREENLRIRPAALDIEGLEVTGVARCDLGSADGSATVRLWDEARKALEVAQWVDEVGYVYETTTFRRVLSADAREVFSDERSQRTLVGQSPFTSIDAETLMAEGFVIRDSLGVSYYGPDASVLLSDAFLSAHCFGAVRADGRLGLAFRPREGRGLPDIEGTLWFLDEGVLDRLEFRYTGVDDYEDASALGGDVEFRRLPQGAWIVQEWRIRMPTRVVEDPGGGRSRLVRIRETGAVVRDARSIPRADAAFGSGFGALRGRVGVAGELDATSARVYLSGTSHHATPGPDGSFLLEGLSPGRYDFVVEHPSLGVMGESPRARSVEVVVDSITAVEVVLPTPEEFLAGRCRGTEPAPLDSAASSVDSRQVLGGVVRTTDGRPAGNRTVRVRWRSEVPGSAGGSPGGRPGQTSRTGGREGWSGTAVRSDARGVWVACGVPEGRTLYVDVAGTSWSEGEFDAGVGLDGEVEILPLAPGSGRWLELQAPAEREALSGSYES